MPLPFQPITVAAGETLTIPGPTYAFSILQAGAGATISEGGGSPQFLGMSVYTSANEHQLFGDLTIVSDSAVATQIAIARSPQQAAKLPPPTGGSPSAGAGAIQTVTITGSAGSLLSSGNPGYIVVTQTTAASNVRTASGTATTTPTSISGALSGGTGGCRGIQISNEDATNSIVVAISGTNIEILKPGTSNKYDLDPNSIGGITVAAALSTAAWGAVAFYR